MLCVDTISTLTHAVMVKMVHAFVAELAVHRRLCNRRVADPAMLCRLGRIHFLVLMMMIVICS